MASTIFYVKKGDTAPSITENLKNADESPIDLTGSTVRFHLRSQSGTIKVNAIATITDATNGQVRYDWQATDLDTAGTYYREWEITLPSTKVTTVPNDVIGYEVRVSDQLA